MTKLNPDAIHEWDKNEEAYIFWKKSSSCELQRWPCRVIQFSALSTKEAKDSKRSIVITDSYNKDYVRPEKNKYRKGSKKTKRDNSPSSSSQSSSSSKSYSSSSPHKTKKNKKGKKTQK
ncbi:hypothetical protein E1301_Tti019667 [Triplophysa tibetana]|uniref:Uncharacterized protein n=1 Tax=Triplophysa tibetana TaxID=1572043 RepID=A0A5A9PGP9_9TELE|nr:hypothetical protein E1301_Tti019667 [Triplophysa tibetana]